MADIEHQWIGNVIEESTEVTYNPSSVEVTHSGDTTPTSYALTWIKTVDALGRYTYVEVITIFQSSEEGGSAEVASRSEEIATAISHSQKSNPPYKAIEVLTGEVVYRSDKTEFKIDENKRCPICFSKIKDQNGEGIQTWENDPIKTPNGLAGVRFQGFQQITLSDVADIQERNIALGMEGTKFESYVNGDDVVIGKRQVQLSDIIDLRDGTEELLDDNGISNDTYFNYDEYGHSVGTNQTDWIDPNLKADTFNIRALHIEDLRHYIEAGWIETWESASIRSYSNGDEIQGDSERIWVVYQTEALTETTEGLNSGKILEDSDNKYLEVSLATNQSPAMQDPVLYPVVSQEVFSLIVKEAFTRNINTSITLTADFANITINGVYLNGWYDPNHEETRNDWDCESLIMVSLILKNKDDSNAIGCNYCLPNANNPYIGSLHGGVFYLSSFDNFSRNIYNDTLAVIAYAELDTTPFDYEISNIQIYAECNNRRAIPSISIPEVTLPWPADTGLSSNQSLSFQLDNIRITG